MAAKKEQSVTTSKIQVIKDQATKVARLQDQLRAERAKLDDLRRGLKETVRETEEWVRNVLNPGTPDETDDE